MEATPPCRTLYIRNLPEKLNKQRLRALLHALLTPYGHILAIIAEKTMKLRGQAFVTFEHQSSATIALRKLHASPFMGRQISVTYAKQLTDRFQPPDSKHPTAPSHNKTLTPTAQNATSHENALPSTETKIPQLIRESPPAPPNRILFIDNLPANVEGDHANRPTTVAAAVTDLFARFAGFMEVRPVPGKDRIAFVEFDSEQNAAVAMSGLQSHPLGNPPLPMHVAFAKK
eukprot:GFKZ01000834.1.p1 GENE.GFKZ01000834.1~~GFKZ01000834.1.p1  ORF type:complete len:230 (+),score=36.03 GFKZ01000834.1:176-865(+)